VNTVSDYSEYRIQIESVGDMLKNRRNGSIIHRNVLFESARDTVALGYALNERFCDVVNHYLRVHHIMIVPPHELDGDMLLWRTMRIRHAERDYRNTRDEILATRRVADWVLQTKCELVGQQYVPLEWGD